MLDGILHAHTFCKHCHASLGHDAASAARAQLRSGRSAVSVWLHGRTADPPREQLARGLTVR